ncbi:cyclophilin-type peptidylprolyl cis-trans [Ordospora colligata]|uniref:Peptidyl-prolyl cis-trans isomerase n=1 Tax=Ordospora colligata OC4 TaxID=1354746 RepID=A0A0B2UKD2_9MICR|nr:cyclophilin-type peptidylprolyl cis-trans [Ordospora colligata OC4]KHN69768.1 cyclophilin-type peptidylprolyl cis-trans [Ordospora colligata OC4]TBU15571.1 cyclophilin-type peptidylprolyl cis-trans [Ordospora colligata]TBU15638.1 cyclophilin-type peptidylprolyl cis-trans [Ordospora colligata]TBU18689.1 cyclophilin-type peptidylprolyl cis-trans [Ordospora colligata]
MRIMIILGASMLSIVCASSSLYKGTPYFNIQYTVVDENGNEEIRQKQMQFILDFENTPLAAENFYNLVKGGEEFNKIPLHYKNSIFHRIIPGFMMQGGDIVNSNGTGSISTYKDGIPFEDENSKILHDTAGVLSMANRGPNTNGSQFFITFGQQKHLDGKHTAFGRIIGQESFDILKEIQQLVSIDRKTNEPRNKVTIIESGIKPLPEDTRIELDINNNREPTEL